MIHIILNNDKMTFCVYPAVIQQVKVAELKNYYFIFAQEKVAVIYDRILEEIFPLYQEIPKRPPRPMCYFLRAYTLTDHWEDSYQIAHLKSLC